MVVTGESINLKPAVTALSGATALLIWTRPDVEQTIEADDQGAEFLDVLLYNQFV